MDADILKYIVRMVAPKFGTKYLSHILIAYFIKELSSVPVQVVSHILAMETYHRELCTVLWGRNT